MMQDKQFIVIEGVIGAGKTALAEYLGETWDARLILESADENPYLEEFYRDRRGYAFQTQITFLLNRYQQQQDLLQRDIFSPRVVSDYLFQKDRIFANLNLSDKELRLYDTLFPILERDVPTPDMVVYLQASNDTLIERLKKRSRSFDKDLSPEYLAALNEAYNYFFFHYDAAPVLVVDSNDFDLTNDPDQGKDLLDRMEEHSGGTVYYRPFTGKDA